MPAPPDKQTGPRCSGPESRGPSKDLNVDSLSDRPDALAEQIRRRVITDALAEGMAATWEHRAAMFEWARPRPDDHNGHATPAELAEADRRCAGIAKACRAKARMAAAHVHDIADLLEEVA